MRFDSVRQARRAARTLAKLRFPHIGHLGSVLIG
jgi:hypothetical protein